MLLRILRPALALTPVLAAASWTVDASAMSLEVSVRPGFGSAGATSPVVYEPPSGAVLVGGPDKIYAGTATPYGLGLNLQGGLGLRAGKYVSVGLEGGYRTSSAEAPDGSFTDLKRSGLFAGPYVRGYVPLVPFLDPWVSVGVQYVSDVQTYKAPVAVGTGVVVVDRRLEHHGVGVPLSIGVDYSVLGLFAVGPSFQYTLVFPAGGCSKYSHTLASSSYCSDEEDRKRITASKGYGVWSLGLNLRVTVPPLL